jgi:hypothetical protein
VPDTFEETYARLERLIQNIAPGAKLICRIDRGGLVTDAAIAGESDAGDVARRLNAAQDVCTFEQADGELLLGRLLPGALEACAGSLIETLPEYVKVPSSAAPHFWETALCHRALIKIKKQRGAWTQTLDKPEKDDLFRALAVRHLLVRWKDRPDRIGRYGSALAGALESRLNHLLEKNLWQDHLALCLCAALWILIAKE